MVKREFLIFGNRSTLAGPDAVRHRKAANWRAIASVLFYLVPATIFFDWWEPINNEFWISPWYAACLLLGLVIASENWRYALPGVAAAAVILAALNGDPTIGWCANNPLLASLPATT